MKLNELEQIINDAFNSKQNISDKSDKKIMMRLIRLLSLQTKGILELQKRKW